MARNKLSMSFTLASVKSSASALTDIEPLKKSMDEERSRNGDSEGKEDSDDDDSDDGEELGKASEQTPAPKTSPKPPAFERFANSENRKPEPRFSWSIKNLDEEL